MSGNNNTTNMKEKQYSHLKKDARTKIESLINQKDENSKRIFNNSYIVNYLDVHNSYIVNYLDVHKSTISRELKNAERKDFISELAKLK